MKITNKQLKQIIKEEIDKVVQEITEGEYAMDWKKDEIEDQISHLFQKYGFSFRGDYFHDDDELIKNMVELGFIIKDPGNADQNGMFYIFDEEKVQNHIFKKAKSMLMDDKTHYYDDVLAMLRHFEVLELIDCGVDCLDKLEELTGNPKIY